MLVSLDREVTNIDATRLVEQRIICDDNSVHERRDQLLLAAAGATIDFDGTALAVATVYTPMHQDIELYRPTPVVRDPSNDENRRRYTPQNSGYELDVSTETAIAWVNDFQHASGATGSSSEETGTRSRIPQFKTAAQTLNSQAETRPAERGDSYCRSAPTPFARTRMAIV